MASDSPIIGGTVFVKALEPRVFIVRPPNVIYPPSIYSGIPGAFGDSAYATHE